jgi:type VI protein secretion system component VasK
MLAFGLLNGHPIITTFGMVGLIDGSTRLAFMFRIPKTRMEWWFSHMTVMLGTGVPLHAAFLLAVGRHLPGPYGNWRLLPSALVIIGLPTIAIWKRYYRNRFEPKRRHVKIENAREAVPVSTVTLSRG